jgi:hypothetical protein
MAEAFRVAREISSRRGVTPVRLGNLPRDGAASGTAYPILSRLENEGGSPAAGRTWIRTPRNALLAATTVSPRTGRNRRKLLARPRDVPLARRSADSLEKPDVRQSMARRARPIRAQLGDGQDVGSTDAGHLIRGGGEVCLRGHLLPRRRHPSPAAGGVAPPRERAVSSRGRRQGPAAVACTDAILAAVADAGPLPVNHPPGRGRHRVRPAAGLCGPIRSWPGC